MLTTPPGTSEVASTSANVTAGSGRSYDETTTAVLPVTITGATTLTSPSSEDSCGASTATTPVGSGVERLKNGPGDRVGVADHLGDLVGPAGVPDQPVDRRVDAPCSALAAVRPSAARDRVDELGRRSSIISATR